MAAAVGNGRQAADPTGPSGGCQRQAGAAQSLGHCRALSSPQLPVQSMLLPGRTGQKGGILIIGFPGRQMGANNNEGLLCGRHVPIKQRG